MVIANDSGSVLPFSPYGNLENLTTSNTKSPNVKGGSFVGKKKIQSNIERLKQIHEQTDQDSENGNTEEFDQYDDAPIKESFVETIETKNNENIIERVNKMITLLENDRNDDNKERTEEIVLYCFLGIFMIYMMDSFIKIGKYIR